MSLFDSSPGEEGEPSSLFDSSTDEEGEQWPILPRPCLADLIRREADPCLTAQEKSDVTKAIFGELKTALLQCDLNHHELVSAIFASIEFGKSLNFVKNVAASSFACVMRDEFHSWYFDFRIMLNPDFVSEIGQSPAVASAHYGRIELMAFFLVQVPSLYDILCPGSSLKAYEQWEEYIKTNPFRFEEQLLFDKNNALWELQIRPILQIKVQNNQLSHDDVCRALVCCAKAKKEIMPVVRFLVEEAGADILYKNDGLNHQTPLELACISGHYDMTVYFLAQAGRCGREVVAQGDMHHGDTHPRTNPPLHFWAARSGHYRLAQHLIETYQMDVSSVYPLEDDQEEKEMDIQSVRGFHEALGKKDQDDTDCGSLSCVFEVWKKWGDNKLLREAGRSDTTLRYGTILHTVLSCLDVANLEQLQQLPGFIKFLLSRGAGRSLNSVNGAGKTPLICLLTVNRDADGSNDPKVCEVKEQALRLLLEAGADVNNPSDSGRTLLHIACDEYDVNAVALLLKHGANVNSVDWRGNTPLISRLKCLGNYLSKEGSDPVICMLLELGADVNISCNDGTTPLHLASEYHCLNVVDLLLKHGGQVNAVDNSGRTPLFCVLGNGVGSFGVRPETELVISMLLDAGADGNISSFDKTTPLHLACKHIFVSGVDLLLKHGADVNAMDIAGRTPLICVLEKLHYERERGEYEENLEIAETVIRKLLEAGASVNISRNNETPLHLACSLHFMHGIDLFLKHGAKVNAVDNQGQTPLMRLLKALGTLGTRMEFSEPAIRQLLEAGADVNISCNDKTTPLHLACELDFMDAVELLLEHGAQVNLVDADGNTPLLVSVHFFCLQVVRRLLQEPDIQVNYANDRSGHSALTLATSRSHPCDFVRFLLDFGASVTQTRWAWGALVVASRIKTREGMHKLFLLVKAFVVEQSAMLNTRGNMEQKQGLTITNEF